MEWKILFSSFSTVLLAELGDKTQLMVLSLTSKTGLLLEVLLGATAALLAATVAAVLAGSLIGRFVPNQVIQVAAGTIFIVFGILALLNKF